MCKPSLGVGLDIKEKRVGEPVRHMRRSVSVVGFDQVVVDGREQVVVVDTVLAVDHPTAIVDTALVVLGEFAVAHKHG